MAKLSRVTAKVFGETATATGSDPSIGQFGSAKAGTYNGTGDVATIQGLSAWSNGWIDAVTPTQQFPTLPEMTGVHKVLSYQNAYLLQQGIPEWDSGTTYYTNGFCSKAGKIYISQSDDNINHDPESDTTNWKEFTSGSSRNIGEFVWSSLPLTDAGLHLADGSLLAYGSYKEFIDYIASIYNSSLNYFCSEADWQASVTAYGSCGKFVYDSVNKTVRLPKVSDILTGITDVSALGSLVEAGLPNITGKTTWFQADYTYRNSHQGSGAFYTSEYRNGGTDGNDDHDNCARSVFDASYSNAIYGNSNTVQPQTIKALLYIVIANTTKTAIEVDIDEIATDLNGKADTDLTNVNDSGTSRGAGWALPSETYESLTLGASGTIYTAPANGWVMITQKLTSGYMALAVVYTSEDGICSQQVNTTSQPVNLNLFIPIGKNENFKVDYAGTLGADTYNRFQFVYAQGSESEAS